MKIGFVGLGNMGAHMAQNLGKSGHKIFGYDVIKKNLQYVDFQNNIQDACKNMDVVITMLPDGKALKEVAIQVLPVMLKEKTFIDCSTIDIETSLFVAKKSKEFKIQNIDAPVSGGIVGAKEGNLTFMVGGNKKAFENIRPLFNIMGKKAVYCGSNGSGQVAKICNNMILGATMISTCETIALADRLGLKREKLFEVVSTSSGFSWSMNKYCPAPGIGPLSPADNNYKPGFASELMLKDLTLSQKAAESVNSDTPMGKLALNFYKNFVKKDGGKGYDFSFILKKFEKSKRN